MTGRQPHDLVFGQYAYEISRLDVAIPHLWRDETRAPVVVHLPVHYFLRAYATSEAVYMLDSTHHWARVVNGFSGASPRTDPDKRWKRSMPCRRVGAWPRWWSWGSTWSPSTDPHQPPRRSLAAFFEEAPWATVYHVGDEHLVRIDPASIPSELVGVTAAGFHATERAEGRAFRWPTGAARLSFPIDPLAPPVGTGRRRADDRPAERSPDYGGRRLCPV